MVHSVTLAVDAGFWLIQFFFYLCFITTFGIRLAQRSSFPSEPESEVYTDHLSQHAASLFSALFAINCWVIVEKKKTNFLMYRFLIILSFVTNAFFCEIKTSSPAAKTEPAFLMCSSDYSSPSQMPNYSIWLSFSLFNGCFSCLVFMFYPLNLWI